MDKPAPKPRRPSPWQFNLKTLLVLTTAFCVLFGVFRWARLSLLASAVMASVFAVSLLLGYVLVVAAAESVDDRPDE
jgi:hypothetical protein